MLKFLAGVIGGLVMLGGVYMAQANYSSWWNNAAPPSVTGPWLGDNNFNIHSLFMAISNNEGRNFWPALSVSQTAAQANCTQLNPGYSQITVSAGAGYVCLPTAYGGREVKVVNGTSQTVNVYSSAASFTRGTTDTINGTAGTTLYAGMTTGLLMVCIAPANGVWNCRAS